jgi:signal transduction histidine kinase
MRSPDLPYLYDWLVISLRWLVLLSLTFVLALTGYLNIFTITVLALLLVWNLAMSVFAILNRRMHGHRLVNLLVDTIAALGIFAASGGAQGPVIWSGLLALFSASIYYEIIGSALIGMAVSLAEIGLTYINAPTLFSWTPLVWVLAINLAGSLGLGFISRLVVGAARGFYQKQVSQRKTAEEIAISQERDQIQAFYALTSTLSTTLNYQRVLDTVLDLGAKVMDDNSQPGNQFVSAVLLFEGEELHIGSSRRLGPADQRVILPGHNGVLADAIQSSDPLVTNDVANDPELGRIVALRSCQSAVCQAMRSGLDVFGLLLFANPEVDFFTPVRCRVLEIISQQAVIAIQNARLYENLEKEKERLIESQEEARKKLARDLHDGPTQTVAAIAMRLNLARRMVQQDPIATADELLRIEEMARRTTKEIRHMLFTLRPLILESQGLVAALQSMAEKMRETYNQNVLIEADPAVIEQLEIGKQTVIFFIVEESVNNARKYAEAAHIWVILKLLAHEKDIAFLEIRDDGLGFDVKAINTSYEKRGSLGMVNLRERTDLINGLLHIDSAPGQGTRVQVYIPLSDEAADRLHRATR